MTETTAATRKPRGDSLSSMLLPELKAMANQMGISGASGMRKGDLVAAITLNGPGSTLDLTAQHYV